MTEIQSIVRLIGRSIVLIGMPGSGKTTIGRKLSKILGLPFYDSDEMVENASGLPLVKIYEERGEDYFRKQEEEAMIEALSKGACIISTGGGTLNNIKIAQIVQDNAIVVWLRAGFETLYKRVIRRNTRPELNVDDRRAVLEDLFTRNSEIYLRASNIIVEAQENEAGFMVEQVIRELEKFLSA